LAPQPGTAEAAEKISTRATRHEMRMQDRMHLILDPRAMTDDLVATAKRRRRRSVSAGGVQTSGRNPAAWRLARTPASILSVLICAWANALNLKRIGDDDACHEGRENPHHGHRVAGRLDHDLIDCLQGLAKPFLRRARHVDGAGAPQLPLFPDDYFREGTVYVRSHAS
jgi:hypothetical protein